MYWFRENKCIVILADVERQAKSIYKFVINLHYRLNQMKQDKRCVVIWVESGEVELYEKISKKIMQMLFRKLKRNEKEK